MHKQIRTKPSKSPADLREFLAVLEAKGVNIEAAGGGEVEHGGEFAFAVEHHKEDSAKEILEKAGYEPRIVDVDHCALDNRPGALLECVAKVAEKNARLGRVIRDISVGVPDKDKRIQVQIYSEAP
jgi:hypothetical protein